MSPEQALGDPLALDLRTDIYALGVILYELLANKLPYNIHRKPLHQALAAIREEEPTPLSSIHRSYRGDIDAIVGKTLEKDKARRYGSAAELANDLRRYLADDPIAARPPSTGYHIQKFTRRHKGLVAAVAAVFLVLAGGVMASTREAIRAREAEHAADAEAATAQAINDFFQNCLLALARAPAPVPPLAKTSPELNVRTFLSFAAARVPGKFSEQPEVEAGIRYTIGSAYLDLGLYGEARKQLERALELHRRILQSGNPRTFAAMSRLGRMAYRLGRTAYLEDRPAEAEATLARVLEIDRQIFPPAYSDTLETLSEMASVYQQRGKYALAERYAGQAFEGRRRALGSEHPDTLESEAALALACLSEGNFAGGERLAREVLAVYQTKHLDDWQRFRAETLLGASLAGEKQYAEAETLLLQGYWGMLNRKARIAAPDRYHLEQTREWIVGLYEASGKPEEAARWKQSVANPLPSGDAP